MTVQPFFLERQRRKRAEDEPTVAAVLPVIINKKMPPTPLPEPPPVISAFKSCRRRLSMRRPPLRLGRSRRPSGRHSLNWSRRKCCVDFSHIWKNHHYASQQNQEQMSPSDNLKLSSFNELIQINFKNYSTDLQFFIVFTINSTAT